MIDLARNGDGAPRVLDLRTAERALGPTAPIRARCHCRRPHIPLHAVDGTVEELRPLLDALPASAVLQTYRCPRCKGIAQVTLGALGLGSP